MGDFLGEGCRQGFFDLFRLNDGELVASFHRQIFGLGCCLFDPDFCPMTGCGQDSNQQTGLPPTGYARSGRGAFAGFLQNGHEERG
jgi:hypothetical protein